MPSKINSDIGGVTDPNVLYHYRLGVFHAMWSTVDLMTDFAIGHFLGLAHEEAHAITWGMMFGPKAKLLARLITSSTHPKKKELLTALNALRGDAKREVIAHGYQLDGPEIVAFLERPRGSDFQTRMHVFTREEFRLHVDKLIGDGNDFLEALSVDQAEIVAFVEAARSLAKRS